MIVNNDSVGECSDLLSRQQIMDGFNLIRDWPFCDECEGFDLEDVENEES